MDFRFRQEEVAPPQFEAAGKVNNCNDLENATALVIALRDPALDLLRSLPAATS